MIIVAEDATLAGRRFGIMAARAGANARQEDVGGLSALTDIVAGLARDHLMRDMVEAATIQPALGNGGRGNIRRGGVAGDFVAIGAPMERRHLARWEGAYTSGGGGAVTVEENPLFEIVPRELAFLEAPHVRLHEGAQCASLSDLLGFAAETFVLLGKTGEKRLHKLDLSVRQVEIGIAGIELQRMAGLAVALEIDGTVVSPGGIRLVAA